MSPAEIKIILHYYAHPGPYRGGEGFDYRNKTIRGFVEAGLLERITPEKDTEKSNFRITEKGCAYVGLLCQTPMPVQIWLHPDKAKELTND